MPGIDQNIGVQNALKRDDQIDYIFDEIPDKNTFSQGFYYIYYYKD